MSDNPHEDQTREPLTSTGGDPPGALKVPGYELLRKLGQGGMGAVYLARQHEPDRLVALKLLSAAQVTPFLRQRLRQEVQALARMSHNHIASVYQAGLTRDGRPYFTIEYIEGESLTRYCQRTKPSLGQRIKLFLQICEGMQHAHQRAILHGDLKPDNLLVTLQGDRPICKVIDFGIARSILDPEPAQPEPQAGTPGYMSPEQLRGVQGDVRSDIYSLGVVLCELLTGLRPFAADSDDDARRALVLPSARFEAHLPEDAYLRDLVPGLRLDLDWIIAKALAYEPERRYGAVGELRQDLLDFLDRRPVSARPKSWSYLAQKFLQRHRLMVGMSGLVLLTLFVGLGLTARATLAEHRARTHAERVSAFLKQLLTRPNPNQEGVEVRLVSVLKEADTLFQGLQDDPAFEIEMRDLLGQTWLGLGNHEEAATQFRVAYTLAHTNYGQAPITWRNGMLLARTFRRQRDYQRAGDLLAAVIAQQRKGLGEQHHETQESLTEQAFLDWDRGQRDASETSFRKLYETQLAAFGTDDPLTVQSLVGLGNAVFAQSANEPKRLDESLALYQAALAQELRLLGPRHPETMAIRINLGNCLMRRGEYAAAAEIFGGVYRDRTALLGADAERTLNAGYSLARALHQLGELEQARDLLLELAPRWQGERGAVTQPYNLLARVYDDLGQPELVIQLLGELLNQAPAGAPPGDAQTLRARQNLANYLVVAKQPLRALEELDRLPAVAADAALPAQRSNLLARVTEAEALFDLGERAPALDLVATALARLSAMPGEGELQAQVEAIYAHMAISFQPDQGKGLLRVVTRAALARDPQAHDVLALYHQHFPNGDPSCD